MVRCMVRCMMRCMVHGIRTARALYKAAGGAEVAKARIAEKPKPGSSRVQSRWRRESAAEWQRRMVT